LKFEDKIIDLLTREEIKVRGAGFELYPCGDITPNFFYYINMKEMRKLIRGDRMYPTCPACGAIKQHGMRCSYCGYPGPSISAGEIRSFPFQTNMVPQSMSGTITFTASQSMAINGLYKVDEDIRNSSKSPEDKIELRSYVGLAQELIESSVKVRLEEHPDHYPQFKELIDKYEVMVQNNEDEPEFQDFFTAYPNFLVSNQIKSQPKPNYGGEFEPDFMIEASDGTHWIIEIEKPSKQLFTQANQPSSKFTQAEQQVRDYLQWARKNIRFLQDRNLNGINQENIYGLLVIGKRSQLTPRNISTLEGMNHSHRSNYVIKTFDDLIMECRALLANWKLS
jgi:Shedu protein SduA, C-terminal